MTRLISSKSSRLKTRQTAGPDLSSFLFFLFLGIELFDTQCHAKAFITWNCGDPQVSVNTGRVSNLINSWVNTHFSRGFFFLFNLFYDGVKILYCNGRVRECELIRLKRGKGCSVYTCICELVIMAEKLGVTCTRFFKLYYYWW